MQIEAEEHVCVLVGRELEPVVDDVHGYGLTTTTVTGARWHRPEQGKDGEGCPAGGGSHRGRRRREDQ